ncbi:MAG: hypothetical protein AB1689_13685 [Thermodesulfobacteriota bacterium]
MRAAAWALAAGLALAACRGPEPQVVRHDVQTSADGRTVRVAALLENRGGGSGQVAVTATLSERASGLVVGRAEREVELAPHERQAVAIDVPLAHGPAPLDPAQLEVHVDAQYPVE